MRFSTLIAFIATAAASAEDQTNVSAKLVSFLSEDNKAEIN